VSLGTGNVYELLFVVYDLFRERKGNRVRNVLTRCDIAYDELTEMV